MDPVAVGLGKNDRVYTLTLQADASYEKALK